jgi:hypothetical protein
MSRIWRKDLAPCICPGRWSESFRERRGNGPGSMSFLRANVRSTRARERKESIT